MEVGLETAAYEEDLFVSKETLISMPFPNCPQALAEGMGRTA